MKNTLLILFLTIILLFISCKPKSQVANSTNEQNDTTLKQPYSRPLAPEYEGGNEAMYAFINKNLKYPEEAKKNNISGAVLVSFTVLSTGELIDVKVQQGIGYGCDEEAVRIVKLMPKWKPGKHLNTPIDMFYSIGILFKNQ